MIPKVDTYKESADFFKRLTRMKYWKNVLTKEEKKTLIKKHGLEKLRDGLKPEFETWMNDYCNLIESGGFVDGKLF